MLGVLKMHAAANFTGCRFVIRGFIGGVLEMHAAANFTGCRFVIRGFIESVLKMHADANFTGCRFVIRGFIESVPAKVCCEKRVTTYSCGDIIYVKENDKEEAKKEDICKLKVI